MVSVRLQSVFDADACIVGLTVLGSRLMELLFRLTDLGSVSHSTPKASQDFFSTLAERVNQ